MKILTNMIDKELRVKGKIMNYTSSSNEAAYIKRAKLNKKLVKGFMGKNIKGIHCMETWIPSKSSNSKIRIRIYQPMHKTTSSPGILWIHGGGYALGAPELNSNMYKRLIEQSGCVIIAPSYRLSGEAPYPAALEDCYDTLLWMKKNAIKLGIRDNQLMVGGESAGGGLTAALTLYARDKGEVNIAFQMPLYPMIDDRMITESSRDNNAPIWNSKSNEWAWRLYLGELYGKEVPSYAAAARAMDYSNLPPTVTFAGDLEPFRDETIQYVMKLREAGVPVDFQLFPGCYHAFDMICPKAEVSKKAVSFLMNSFQYAVNNYFAEQK